MQIGAMLQDIEFYKKREKKFIHHTNKKCVIFSRANSGKKTESDRDRWTTAKIDVCVAF